MAVLGGMTPVEETANQVQFPCGQLHTRALRFLLSQAVGKAPDYSPPQGRLSINDTKSSFTINVESPQELDGEYRVFLEGEGGNAAMRHRMVMAGFARYGEMVQIGDSGLSFPCGMKHDALMRVLLPYSRNISSVETMMAAEALRSQMTTNTLGFSADIARESMSGRAKIEEVEKIHGGLRPPAGRTGRAAAEEL